MKRFHPLMPALLVGLVVLILLWRSERSQNLDSNVQGFRDPRNVGSSVVPYETNTLPIADRFAGALAWRMAGKGKRFISTELQLPVSPEISWHQKIVEPAFEEFRVWVKRLPERIDKRELAEGARLARSRRVEMLKLIQSNPRRALQLAVPSSVRENLPSEISGLLEESVDGFGDLVAIATSWDRGCQIDREVTLRDGRKFDAYTYGRRSAIATRDNLAIHGVSIDGQLALGELPGRLVESEDSADTIRIVFGDERIVEYDNEASALAALLLAEENELSGVTAALANDLDGVIAYSPATEGEKTLLIIRVDFPDFQGGSASDSQLQSLISEMNSVYRDMSYGKASFALNGQGSAFTPTLRLPNNASYYNNFSRILTAARSAAATAGYNHNDYTYEVVVTGNQPVVNGSAGVAFVGSRGAWLHNRQWNLKTCAHEIGHNFGLLHSGAWDTDDGSVIGPGSVWEYGNEFDIMGVGSSPHGSRHFSASVKNYLDWIPDSDLVKITVDGSSTTRIRAMDKVQADGNKRGLVINRPNSTRDYWVEHRQLYGSNFGMRDGVLINWADINGGKQQQPLLLDMKPTTSSKVDGVLPIGMTFSDAAAGVHITPVARGTDPDGVNWIDVTVNRGSFPGNQPPSASLSVTDNNPTINGSVTFTCAASDPDGDPLAYFWDWGNGTSTATNRAVASKSWPKAGFYIVQCTVSDMKGQSIIIEYVVQVGGSGFFIEGKVRTIQGDPLSGVVVSVSPTQKATSDAAGRYIISGLPAGTYTAVASGLAPDGFTNPVTLGPSLQNKNFVRVSYPFMWDANSAIVGAQDGSGNWTDGGGSWYNTNTGADNQKWTNIDLDSATFGAGVDGAYTINLSGSVQAGGGIKFASSGYTLAGGTALLMHNGAENTSIRVMADKSATIQSAITYQHNQPAMITVDAGGVLNLAGGASNSQYQFNGGGTVNMISGSYAANVGAMAAASFNQIGGDLVLSPGNNVGFSISSNSRNVHYTHSGGAMTLDGNNSASIVKNAFLGIGNGTGISNTSTMTLTDGAVLNVGAAVDRSGEIRIASTAESNGTLDVQGGLLTVGSASSQNKIYFFKAGASDAPYLARMLQSGGTVITNGIQFGGDIGTYDPTSSAFLHLSGGSLYVGAEGISRGLAADELAVEILLEGGVLGASQSWSSNLDMQIGPQLIIQAQDSFGIGRNITLRGKISDDGDIMGSLVKDGPGMLSLQGANSFRGALSILNGSVEAKTNSNALGLGGVSMGGPASSGATLLLGNIHANPIMVDAPGSGEVIIAANGPGSGFTLSGAITLNGDLTLKTFDNAINGDFRAVAGITGGISGNGNLILDNLGLAANAINITGKPINHSGSLTLQGTATGDTRIGATIGPNVTDLTQNSASSTLVLSGNNSYQGSTVISVGTLRLGANNVLPDGAGKGDVALVGTLDLNGFSETINGLTGRGTVDNSSTSNPAALTVMSNSTFSGVLRNSGAALALVKAGNSDFILTGSNTYSGGTTIHAGRLFIANSAALSPNGDVQINNEGSLNLNAGGSPIFNQKIILASGGRLAMRKTAVLTDVSLPESGLVVFNSDDQDTVAFSLNGDVPLDGDLTIQVGGAEGSPGAVSLTGEIQGSGGIIKTESGTLLLSGTLSYTGATTVSGGTLDLVSSALASPITLEAGAQLGLRLGTTVTSSAPLVLAPGHAIVVNGVPELQSYTLFTSSGSISGSPVLSEPIPDYQLVLIGGKEIRLIRSDSSPYLIWSAGADFDADANGDGVSNGMAFLIGAESVNADARALLPKLSRNADSLALSFNVLNPGRRGNSVLALQYSSDMGLSDTWLSIPIGDATTDPSLSIDWQIIDADPHQRVTASIATSNRDKLFLRFIARE